MLRFSRSGSVGRKKCGHGTSPCSTTCNLAMGVPMTCSNRICPHTHHDYDVIPTLFTVVHAHGSEDGEPLTPDGAIIGSAMFVSTQVGLTFRILIRAVPRFTHDALHGLGAAWYAVVPASSSTILHFSSHFAGVSCLSSSSLRVPVRYFPHSSPPHSCPRPFLHVVSLTSRSSVCAGPRRGIWL